MRCRGGQALGRGRLLVKGVGLYSETEWQLRSHWRFLEDLSVCSRETDTREARVDALGDHCSPWTEMRMTWTEEMKGNGEVGTLE